MKQEPDATNYRPDYVLDTEYRGAEHGSTKRGREQKFPNGKRRLRPKEDWGKPLKRSAQQISVATRRIHDFSESIPYQR